MPRKEGAASTRKTVTLENAVVMTFAFPHEFTTLRIEGRLCCITDCENRVSQEGGGVCGRVLNQRHKTVRHWVDGGGNQRTDPVLDVVGWACQSCTDRITGGTPAGRP